MKIKCRKIQEGRAVILRSLPVVYILLWKYYFRGSTNHFFRQKLKK